MRWIVCLMLVCFLNACAMCSHKNLAGNCLSDEEYTKMITHDAAYNATVEFSRYCSTHTYAPECQAPSKH